MSVEHGRKAPRARCPCGHHGRLQQTGVFSICNGYGLAITGQALAYAQALAGIRGPGGNDDRTAPASVGADESPSVT